MNKQIRKLSVLFIFVFLATCMLAGCGSGSNNMKTESMDGGAASESLEISGDLLDYESSENAEIASESSVSTNRKIIERVYLYAETKEFDSLLNKLEEELVKIGGYIESSSVSGNSYRYEGNRYADFTVRVPSDKSDTFTAFVSENSTVTSKEISTEDVTLSYVDMESRVSALETEKTALENLLAKAESLDDIITIQERLTDVIYEIESYQSKLRTYDNLIEYTTISIRINEVERVTVVEEQTIWEEMGTNLKENFESVGHGLVRAFVFVVSSIPYLLILAVMIIIVRFLLKMFKRRAGSRPKREKITKEYVSPTYTNPEILNSEKKD